MEIRFHHIDDVLNALRDGTMRVGDLWQVRPGHLSRSVQYENGVFGWETIISEMYGWPFDQEPEAPKPPEKSPADKALDEFIKRREAKRNGSGANGDDFGLTDGDRKAIQGAWDNMQKQEAESKALGNAMSKLTHWEVSFRERLSPYRVVL